MHDIGKPTQHHEVSVRFEISGVAGMQPAILQAFAGGCVLLEITAEYAFRTNKDFAGVADLDIDAGQGTPDCMQTHFIRPLDGVIRAALGLAVELPQLDAERAIEYECIFPHGFAASECAAQARQPELILDRAADQPLADRVERTLLEGGLLTLQLAPFGGECGRHEELIDRALQRRGIFHADLDRGQQVIPASRCGEIERRGDLAQVVEHGLLTFRNIDGEAKRDTGCHRHREIADPGDRQIGQNSFAKVERAAAMCIAHTGQQIPV